MFKKILQALILIVGVIGTGAILFYLSMWLLNLFSNVPGGFFITIIIMSFIAISILIFLQEKNPKLFDIVIDFLDKNAKMSETINDSFVKELRTNIMHDSGDAIDINNSDTNVNNSNKKAIEKDILELMLANMQEIRDYYTLSKIQARNSFWFAVIMCIIGIVFIGIAVVSLFVFNKPIEAAIIPAFSGAIVEIIAGTIFVIYKNSLKQLNHYYASLHNNERFLSTVNLVSKVSEDKKDEMYFEIIKSELNVLNSKKQED